MDRDLEGPAAGGLARGDSCVIFFLSISTVNLNARALVALVFRPSTSPVVAMPVPARFVYMSTKTLLLCCFFPSCAAVIA